MKPSELEREYGGEAASQEKGIRSPVDALKKLLWSFHFAFNGLVNTLKSEQNMRIHAVGTVVAVTMGILLHISAMEWIAVILCIGLVTSAEIFNTAIEILADRVTMLNDELIRRSKDAAAAGVMVISFATLIVGGIVFLPKILELFRGA